jgi:hypothetical protein
MKTNPQLDKLLRDLDRRQILSDASLELWEIADAWVQFDSEDRVNEVGLFEEGLELAQKAGNHQIFRVDHDESAYYFIGTVAGIIQRIKSAAGVP